MRYRLQDWLAGRKPPRERVSRSGGRRDATERIKARMPHEIDAIKRGLGNGNNGNTTGRSVSGVCSGATGPRV